MTDTVQDRFSLLFSLARLIDPLIVLFLSVSTHILLTDPTERFGEEYQLAWFFAVLISLVIFSSTNLYSSLRGKFLVQVIQRVTSSWAITLLALLATAAFFKYTASYSRLWFGVWATSTWFALIFYRLLILKFLARLRAKGLNRKKIIIYGAGHLGKSIAEKLLADDEIGYDIIAFIDDDKSKWNQSFLETPIMAPPERLDSYISEMNVLELWIALPLRNEERVKVILSMLGQSTVQVRFVPDIFGFQFLNHEMDEIVGIPVINLNTTPLSSGANLWIKWIEDRVLGLLILILISPLLIIIGFILWVESGFKGPILFKQMRHGGDGKPIKVYKFKTMKVLESSGAFTPATKNDARVTKVGKILRQTSLDELPQFINVLQGRMSIVGPRPQAISQNHEFKEKINYYMQRHKVKPGITGWAQVNGWRGEVDTLEKMQKRIEFDLYYIQHWSLLFDLKIILLTIIKGFYHKNAY